MTLESDSLMLLKLDVHLPSTNNSINYLSEVPRIKLDRSVSSFVLRRRHGVSSGNDCVHQPMPRMKRRGAISYDVTDASAMYIRYLGRQSLHASLLSPLQVSISSLSLSLFLSLSVSLSSLLCMSLSSLLSMSLSPLSLSLSPLYVSLSLLSLSLSIYLSLL